MPYCIYSDQDVPIEATTKEHVIPLSLGGADGFTIRVAAKANSEAGSRVDGLMANDFLMLFRRDRSDALGHSKNHPRPVARKAHLADGRPVQVSFAKTGMEVWGARERRSLAPHEIPGGVVHLKVEMGIDTPVRFMAKVALGAGYFAYGDEFRKVRTQDLRFIMNHYGPLTDNVPDGMSAMLHLWHMEEMKEEYEFFFTGLFKDVPGSGVLMLVGRGQIKVAISILGEYLGFIGVTGDTSELPRGGHLIYVNDGVVHQHPIGT